MRCATDGGWARWKRSIASPDCHSLALCLPSFSSTIRSLILFSWFSQIFLDFIFGFIISHKKSILNEEKGNLFFLSFFFFLFFLVEYENFLFFFEIQSKERKRKKKEKIFQQFIPFVKSWAISSIEKRGMIYDARRRFAASLNSLMSWLERAHLKVNRKCPEPMVQVGDVFFWKLNLCQDDIMIVCERSKQARAN